MPVSSKGLSVSLGMEAQKRLHVRIGSIPLLAIDRLCCLENVLADI